MGGCMSKHVVVMVGRSEDNRIYFQTHFRLYTNSDRSDRVQRMVFDGSDGVTIGEAWCEVNTHWFDLKEKPDAVKKLVGPKGFAFLKILNRLRVKSQKGRTPVRRRKRKPKVFFFELQVISAWQFVITSRYSSDDTRKIVFAALQKHLRMIPKTKIWILQDVKY